MRERKKQERETQEARERERAPGGGVFSFSFFCKRGQASEGGKRNCAAGSGGCNVAFARTTARSRICKDFQQKAAVLPSRTEEIS